MLSCAGTDVDDVIGGVHRILVVFDNDQRIAEIAQMAQRREQAVIVALMEADARFVEDVEHAHQARADLRCKTDALCLSARESCRSAREREIVQAHIEEEVQARVNLFQNFCSNLRLTRAEFLLRLCQKCVRIADGECRKIGDILPADCHGKRLWFQPRPVTRRTRRIRHIVLITLAHLLGVRLAVAARKRRQNTLIGHIVLLFLAEHICILEGNIFLRAIEKCMLCFLVHAVPRCMLVVIMLAEKRRDRAHPVGVRIFRERRKDAVRNAERRVRQDKFGIELLMTAESRTDRACTERAVEREHARGNLGKRDAAVHAGKILTEHEEIPVHDLHIDHAAAGAERGLK